MFKNKSVSVLLFLIFSFQFLQTIQVEITLSSSMVDTSEDTYEISNKIVILNKSTDYTIKGTCSECGIEVKKGTSPTITLSSINIDNSKTGPFVIKKNCEVKLILEGKSTIIDKEKNETSSDFEGAGIKFKSGSNLTISGSGSLIILGNIKNGIKGASLSNLIINSGTLNITCVNNAIAADDSIVINGGNFYIKTTEGDGIKSDPDADDADSKGTLTINGGNFYINSYNDGIQAKTKLIINDGNFSIKTYKNGASSSGFNKDTESAKGIKVSTNETNINIELIINGGNFNLNTIDDAVHSDGDLTIKGGSLTINTGDDGIHADKNLILGEKNAKDDLIKINITKSYEGIEGAQIYIYSGTYRVIAQDDGINSAGDSTEECRGGVTPNNNNNNFGPRGNNNRPGGLRNLRGKVRKLQSQCAIYHMNIYGGNIYVNAEHDGLDANGNVNIYGGNIEVWGARANSDGDFIDLDGKMSITGGTIFGGGNAGMINPTGWQNSQGKIYQQGQVGANSEINVVSGSTNIKTYVTPKNINYIYYSSPSVDSNYKFSVSNTGSSNNPGNPNSSNMPAPPNSGNNPGTPPNMNPGSSDMPSPPNSGNNPGTPSNMNPGSSDMPAPPNSGNNPGTPPNMNPGSSDIPAPPNSGNNPGTNNNPDNPGANVGPGNNEDEDDPDEESIRAFINYGQNMKMNLIYLMIISTLIL